MMNDALDWNEIFGETYIPTPEDLMTLVYMDASDFTDVVSKEALTESLSSLGAKFNKNEPNVIDDFFNMLDYDNDSLINWDDLKEYLDAFVHDGEIAEGGCIDLSQEQIETNGDGCIDCWGEPWETNGDGCTDCWEEPWETNGDGCTDCWGEQWETNGDGCIDCSQGYDMDPILAN